MSRGRTRSPRPRRPRWPSRATWPRRPSRPPAWRRPGSSRSRSPARPWRPRSRTARRAPSCRPSCPAPTPSRLPSRRATPTTGLHRPAAATFVAPRIATTTTATAVFKLGPPAHQGEGERLGQGPLHRLRSGDVRAQAQRPHHRQLDRHVVQQRASRRRSSARSGRTGRYVVVAKYLGTSTYEGSRDRVRLS